MASSSPTPRTPPSGTGFPAGAAVALLCTGAALLGWHAWKKAPGGGGGLPPRVFEQAFSLQLRKKPAVEEARGALNGIQGTLNSPPPQPKPGARPAISPVLVDDSGALDPFFAALWHLEKAKTQPSPGSSGGLTHAMDGTVVTNGTPLPVSVPAGDAAPDPLQSASMVTVLHYGDSPTTADLITGDARALLQARFGDAGHGFNLVAKPWAWYGHRDVAISDSGWKATTPVGSMREGVYGLGGATLTGSTGARSTFKLSGAAQAAAELTYMDEPGGGSFTVSAGGTDLKTIATDGPADTPAWTTVKLPAGTKELEVAVSSGSVKMLGIDFRTDAPGVLYDSMGLNGATTSVMARGFGKATWPAELQHARPALVVINYGTNESSFAPWVTKSYENELRMAIARVRAALPDVPILIMSPMDRGERAGLNDIETMDTIPEIVAIQRRVAADLHCAFFDTFDAMGGSGTMAAWYTGKPRLVSADLIHPTPQGALIVATKLVDNLDLGYDRWKRLHGIAVAPAQPPGLGAGEERAPEPAQKQVPQKASLQKQVQSGATVTHGKDSDATVPVNAVPAKRDAAPPVAPTPEPLKTPTAKTPDTEDR